MRVVTLWLIIFIILYGIIGILNVRSMDSGHCSLTTRLSTSASQRKVIPERTSDGYECSNRNISKLDVRLCPDKHYIKFSIKLNQSRDMNISLCYTIQTIIDWKPLVTHCFKIQFSVLEDTGQLDCWFQTEYIERRPVIIASVDVSNDMTCQSMYGEINTGTLDLSNSCIHICATPVTLVYGLVSCDNTVAISHDRNTTIVSATFTADNNKSSCTDIPMAPVSHVSSSSIKRWEYFKINCDYVGPGNVHVTYTKNDVYCLTTHDVHVLCNSGDITAHSKKNELPESSDLDSKHKAVYITTTTVSLTAIITSVIFFIIWRRKQRLRQTRHHRSSNSDRSHQQAQPLVEFGVS